MPARPDAGELAPVVLLHGCGGTAERTFEATGLTLALRQAGRTLVPISLPGHGRPDASTDPADYADLAGELAPLLPPGPIDAVGYSLGGKLLLELAIREPERIGRMVLGGVGDNVFAPETVAEAAATALEDGPTSATPPSVLAFLEAWEPDRNAALAVAAILRRPPNPVFAEAGLAALRARVLLVNGDADPAARDSARLRSALPQAGLVTLPGVGHFDLPAAPGFVRAAVDFLTSGEAHGRRGMN